VLLDLLMPVMDGYEVMEKLNEIERDSSTPVLVLSAQTDPEARLRALKLGAKDFTNKPLDLSEIQQRIKNMLEVRMLYNQVLRQNTELEQIVQERTRELETSLRQLMHAEKLSAVGKMAAAICHEFNNPILGIRNILMKPNNFFLDSTIYSSDIW
jgi:PleD family two-component response regulator